MSEGFENRPAEKGPESRGSTEGFGHSTGDADTDGSGDHLRKRPRASVLKPADIDLLEEDLREAFEAGDPLQAWEVSRRALVMLRKSVRDAAKDRFRANFGGPSCETCDGLKAGPSVVATCFQTKSCFYGSQKTSDLEHSKVIKRLVPET